MVDDKNQCTKYGRHCAKAHHTYDKRLPNNNKVISESNGNDDLQTLTHEVMKMINENKQSQFEEKMNNVQNALNAVNNGAQRKKMMLKLDGI